MYMTDFLFKNLLKRCFIWVTFSKVYSYKKPCNVNKLQPEWTVESPRWDIAVVSGARAGDYRYHDGVVLVRDKERGEWRSIHDCRRIDIRNVRGNTLFADFFDDCDVDGDDWTGLGRHHFKVDLLTWKAQRVKGWAPCEAPSTLEEWERCGEACPSSGACPATGGHDGIRLEKIGQRLRLLAPRR